MARKQSDRFLNGRVHHLCTQIRPGKVIPLHSACRLLSTNMLGIVRHKLTPQRQAVKQAFSTLNFLSCVQISCSHYCTNTKPVQQLVAPSLLCSLIFIGYALHYYLQCMYTVQLTQTLQFFQIRLQTPQVKMCVPSQYVNNVYNILIYTHSL